MAQQVKHNDSCMWQKLRSCCAYQRLQLSGRAGMDVRECWDINTWMLTHISKLIYKHICMNNPVCCRVWDGTVTDGQTATVQRNVTYRLSHSLEGGKQDRTTETGLNTHTITEISHSNSRYVYDSFSEFVCPAHFFLFF